VPIAVIFEGNPIGHSLIATNAGAQSAVLHYTWITPEFINDAHAHNVSVFAYTVNDKAIALKLKNMNIDGIITNYPDIMNRTK
jgi:glycerophosphoryl diester phosphodiesterase